MDYLTAANTLRTTKIEQIITESPSVKTFIFKDKQCAKAKPGQFLMLWIPGIDEIPLSIFNATKNGKISVSVKAVGEATQHLHNMKTKETIGIRGPFGNNFTPPTVTQMQANILLIGGGTGTAPLLFLAKTGLATIKPKKLTFIVGARTQNELLFTEHLFKICQEGKLITTTNDGTHGHKGVVTEPLTELLSQEKFDAIYTCGPEIMVKKIFETTQKHKQPLQASLERLMRCGIGLCGSCTIGKYRVCKDGPIFNNTQLDEIKNELGISKLNPNGSKTFTTNT
ncbi:MAG: dihydroorotate dehydrogenase electron transfer subunit [Candidatus Bathyarchaeota archaeon]|uniref:dihydroorotate dehydrogenase electron transfer subunit n=1 Tax=Candidatus Bathycorpusculum sp. TaxID=2994959 RepID=UPI00282283D3|nr:dihydroorotate dehydrogenase electron transfer subunit [Candidatus Termiticorpusculum sp.]MCL2257813.1 dihydroorotate dehydrogenase electron transfer subunit [Candidatus Termiticorpusculum sp.]MCL2292058.1 dihydroorotate dehydrogenase electron transfer subunit [Candidatus Termiticorpusculum sp.]